MDEQVIVNEIKHKRGQWNRNNIKWIIGKITS